MDRNLQSFTHMIKDLETRLTLTKSENDRLNQNLLEKNRENEEL